MTARAHSMRSFGLDCACTFNEIVRFGLRVHIQNSIWTAREVQAVRRAPQNSKHRCVLCSTLRTGLIAMQTMACITTEGSHSLQVPIITFWPKSSIFLTIFTGCDNATLGLRYAREPFGVRSNICRAGVDCPVVPTSHRRLYY